MYFKVYLFEKESNQVCILQFAWCILSLNLPLLLSLSPLTNCNLFVEVARLLVLWNFPLHVFCWLYACGIILPCYLAPVFPINYSLTFLKAWSNSGISFGQEYFIDGTVFLSGGTNIWFSLCDARQPLMVNVLRVVKWCWSNSIIFFFTY